MAEGPPVLGLVGDIGGTNARFALATFTSGRSKLVAPRNLLCRDHVSVEHALDAYLAEHAPDRRPEVAVIAVAGPVHDGTIAFTNMGWRFSEAHLRQALRLTEAKLINDYAALALAAPTLRANELRTLGPDVAGRADATLAILGAGTGFGVSALVREAGREAILTSEGGHIGFAPTDDVEVEIWRILGRRFGRVSVERILSGPGLLDLYGALAEIAGQAPTCPTPDAVTRSAAAGDPLAQRAVERFCMILGSVAGDLALAYGAQGGVFIAGGVAPNMTEALGRGDFRRRFEAKGRFEPYLQAIPTRLVIHPHTALLGAARALHRSMTG